MYTQGLVKKGSKDVRAVHVPCPPVPLLAHC